MKTPVRRAAVLLFLSTLNLQLSTALAGLAVTGVACGGGHSLFIKSDGSLWGMGDNGDGELGNGTSGNTTNLPIQIVSGGVTAVAAGDRHSLFIKSDGSLWGMGHDFNGQLGVGGFPNQQHLAPVQIVAGPPPAPVITGISLAKTNLNLTGANGVAGEIMYTLMSTNPTQPLSQWRPIATNALNTNGNFTISATNAVTPNAAQRFNILQAQ